MFLGSIWHFRTLYNVFHFSSKGPNEQQYTVYLPILECVAVEMSGFSLVQPHCMVFMVLNGLKKTFWWLKIIHRLKLCIFLKGLLSSNCLWNRICIKHDQHQGDAKHFTLIACGKQCWSENWTLFARAVIDINMGCFASKCTHKTLIKCVQTVPQRNAVWLAVQFVRHVTLCDSFVN